MTPTIDRALVWFRRDLRVADHAALYHALRSAREVWCAFVFDRDILDPLPRRDRRVEFIHASLADLQAQLEGLRSGARLLVRCGRAVEQIAALAAQLRVQAVYANHDDDPSSVISLTEANLRVLQSLIKNQLLELDKRKARSRF